jgi:hypothetical protein
MNPQSHHHHKKLKNEIKNHSMKKYGSNNPQPPAPYNKIGEKKYADKTPK